MRIRVAVDASPLWSMRKETGAFSTANSAAKSGSAAMIRAQGAMGGRPCAVFEYCGPAMDAVQATRLIAA